MKLALLGAAIILLPTPACAFFGSFRNSAEDCAQRGVDAWVYGGGECLKVIAENPIQEPSALVVFIHGDVSKGGPADYLAKRMGRLNLRLHIIICTTLKG